jgi:hypothetical protein
MIHGHQNRTQNKHSFPLQAQTGVTQYPILRRNAYLKTPFQLYWLYDLYFRMILENFDNFSLHHRVQTGSSRAHPASYLIGTRDPFPGGKASGVWSWPLTSI